MTKPSQYKQVLINIMQAFKTQDEANFNACIAQAEILLAMPEVQKKVKSKGIVCTATDDGRYAWEYQEGRITLCTVAYDPKAIGRIKAAATARANAACRGGDVGRGKEAIMTMPERSAA